jgi:aryl-alcohol dehydrogenase-like predicted oxidoreductase
MEYRPLGRTGVQVSKLCLGTMMFGAWGNTDHDDSIRIIHRALDAGINFVDTADVYSAGESEEIVGKAIRTPPTRRDDVVLATKFGVPMDEDPNHRGGSRRWIVHEVENSLRRLGTDYIDLYQLHRPDPWASSATARSPAAGCRAAGLRTPRPCRRLGSDSPRASTCRCPRTSASSKPSSSSRRSPMTPVSR